MERYKRFLLVAASLTLVFALVSVIGPKEVHALVATMVQVANTASTPVPTVRVDNPARQAVVLTLNGQINNGLPNNNANFQDTNGDYTVPTGKRLVIESVSGYVSIPTGEKVDGFYMIYTGNGVTGRLYQAPVFTTTVAAYDDFLFATQFTTYADAGTQIAGSCFRYPSTGVGQCGATLSGHLESIQ